MQWKPDTHSLCSWDHRKCVQIPSAITMPLWRCISPYFFNPEHGYQTHLQYPTKNKVYALTFITTILKFKNDKRKAQFRESYTGWQIHLYRINYRPGSDSVFSSLCLWPLPLWNVLAHATIGQCPGSGTNIQKSVSVMLMFSLASSRPHFTANVCLHKTKVVMFSLLSFSKTFTLNFNYYFIKSFFLALFYFILYYYF